MRKPLRYHADEPELDAYYADIEQAHLQPLWEMSGLSTPTPVVKAVPYRWVADELQKLATPGG